MMHSPQRAGVPSTPGWECEKQLRIFVQLLGQWRTATNLISEASFADVWTRHIADSGQLLEFAPSARRWVDLGSGAGFPGMVIAIQLARYPDAVVHCVESDKRKAAFLRQVARATGAPVVVHVTRIEALEAHSVSPVDAVTARGLAPLPRLVEYANVWLRSGAIGIFPCGRSAQKHGLALARSPGLEIETFPNKFDSGGRIVRIRCATQGPP